MLIKLVPTQTHLLGNAERVLGVQSKDRVVNVDVESVASHVDCQCGAGSGVFGELFALKLECCELSELMRVKEDWNVETLSVLLCLSDLKLAASRRRLVLNEGRGLRATMAAQFRGAPPEPTKPP